MRLLPKCFSYTSAYLCRNQVAKVSKIVTVLQTLLCTVTVKSFIKCANFLKIVRPFSCIYCSAYLCKKSSYKSLYDCTLTVKKFD